MEFYRPMKILKKRFNDTFLVLIPKKKWDDNDLKDLRPINLVGGLYKLLAKVNSQRKWDDSDLKDFKPINLVGDLYKLLAKVLENRSKRGVVDKVVF